MTFQATGAVGTLLLCNALMCAAASEPRPDATTGSATILAAAKDDELPLSKDALFDTAPDAAGADQGKATDPADTPTSKDELFALEPLPQKSDQARPEITEPGGKEPLFSADIATEWAEKAAGSAQVASPIRGYFQTEVARTYAAPDHWSKVLGRLELGSQGSLGRGMQWKLSGRFDYNAVYDLTDFYQPQVRDDQRVEFQLRETYLDFSAGEWDWRVGRQQVVWGEMVGLFFADVVSAKDMREFVLPDFQVLRIPQWAARAEYFKDDFYAEAVFIPFPSYDNIGKPKDYLESGAGADFYPYPPALAPIIREEEKPGVSLDHSNFGVRLSKLTQGWDLAAFFYTSMNSAATFYRTGLNTFTPRHDRIWQLGGTLAKDLGDFVLKAEAVYSDGRRYNLRTNLMDPDGVVEQDNVDWVVGADFNPSSDTRVNVQLFQRYFFDHDPDIIPDKAENGMSLLVSHKFSGNWTAEALLVHSLVRSDWMFRPRASWGFQPNWKLTFGADVFDGQADRFFGQYDNQDRVYGEIRHDF